MSTDFYIRENDELSEFKCDQTIIIKKRLLPLVSRLNYKKEPTQPGSSSLEWFPYVNSYYPYTEDVDAFARVNHLLETRQFCVSTSSFNTCTDEDENDPYSEKGAQLQYLQSRPVCFFIVGKPDIGELELGKLLADYWKCIYIDPETLINEEIHSFSRAGQCIEFNLRCGRAIGIDVILRLLEKRVKTKSAEHRGFVICGFPLIPNDLYEEDPVSSESAVFTVQDIFEEIFETTIEIGVPPQLVKNVSKISKLGGEDASVVEEEPDEEKPPDEAPPVETIKPEKPEIPIDIGSAHDNICKVPEIGTNYDEQLNFILNQFSTPFFIIYIMCPNADVVERHNNYRFNIYSGEMIDLQMVQAEKVLHTLFSREPGVYNEEIPDDFFDTKIRLIDQDIGYRHLVHLPRDFPYNVVSQLDRYHYAALSIIERHVLIHDPQYFIKLDGRAPPARMFNIVKTRLRILPIPKVIIPEKLDVPPEPTGAEEEQAVDFNIEGLTPSECFVEFRKRNIANKMFKWTWSDWGAKCPVSMKEGLYINGDPKYAVQFMNKMFFLKDEDAYIKFYRNPRPYLLPPYPRISCRIFVMGPKYSGKSAVSKCLAYLLDGQVFCPVKMEQEYLKQLETEYLDNIKSAALNEGISLLNEQRKSEWDTMEEERKLSVQFWLDTCRTMLKKRIVMQRKDEIDNIESEGAGDTSLLLLSSFPMKLTNRYKSFESIISGLTELNFYSLTNIQTFFDDLHLPCFDDDKLCKILLENEEKLLEYLPNDLKFKEFVAEPATIFDDFVQKYAEDAVTNANFGTSELNTDHLYEMFVNHIKEFEDYNEKQGKNRGGWIIDGMPPNRSLFERFPPELMADDIFLLTDDPDHHFLINRFMVKGLNEFYDFRNFFLSIDNMDAAWRSPSHSTDSFKLRTAQDIMENILDYHNFPYEESSDDEYENELLGKPTSRSVYKKELKNFYEEWDNLSQFFIEQNIEPIEFSIADKSIIDLMKDVIKNVEDRYRQLGSIFSPEDRLQEVEDFGEQQADDEELGGEEEGEEEKGEDMFLQNRRYGDTFHYCPVAFHDHWVLWKGKEEFGAKFENKLYFMCTEYAMNDFIIDPRKYLMIKKPPPLLPPPRICVVGASGCGKTTTAKAISHNLGLFYINFELFLKNQIDPKSEMSLSELIKESENEIAVVVDEYMMSDAPLPNEMLLKLLTRLWFEEPIKSTGFVLDDFPKRPTDVDFMERYSFIPDIILELSISEEVIHKRILEKQLEAWTIKMREDQEMQDIKNREVTDEWEEKRNARFKELVEIKREERYAAKKLEKEGTGESPHRPYLEDLKEVDEEVEKLTITRPKSQVSFDSVAEEADIEEIEKFLAEELPEPVFEDNWETIEEATERFGNQIEDAFVIDTDFLRTMRENADAELIPWTEINANLSSDKVIAQAYRVTNPFKFRNNSVFERCYDITPDIAEKLLNNGYYFLSKFGRTCPVQYCEKQNPVQMFLPLEKRYQVFPMIHRQYIYFLAGRENRNLFKEDPLKYITQENVNFPLIPLKIAIIGPPKCGKTCLAERFNRDLGLKIISRGQAVRYVLKCLSNSQLAINMEFVLRKGWELTDEMVIRSVEAFVFDGKSITQGFVFDGFPNSLQEVRHLAEVGLVPQLVIDLQADREEVYMCLSTDVGKRNLPLFSKRFIDHRYDEWQKIEAEFNEWFDREYQILAKRPIKPSKWGVWTTCYELATAVFSEIKHYYKNACRDWPLRLANMQITPLEFLERRSDYKQFCPCCLHYFNKLINSGDPPDRTGLVQYRKYFYWICNEHINEFIDNPDQFLPPYNKHCMPADIPVRIYLSEKPENCYENGVCIICFKDNRPKHIMNEGDIKYAVLYRDIVYLFDSLSCLNKFMCEPHLYFNITINYKGGKPYPLLEYRELPILGLLEQYIARQVVKAVTNTGILRPVIPASRVPVPDERFDYLCEYFKPLSKVPAFLNVVDIAGLVKGASEGQGLGNAFLSHISACDAVFHLCRAFEDDDVTHIEGDVNPIRDLEIIGEELRLKDEEQLMKNLEKLERTVLRGGDKKLKPEYDTLVKIKGVLVDQKQHIRFADWNTNDIEILNKYLFLTTKPALYLINLAEKDYIKKKNKWLVKIKEWVDKNDPGAIIIPFSGMFEQKLIEFEDPVLRKKFLEDNNTTSALDKIIVQGYKALQLEYFFTAGPDEVKAWTIQKGTKAPQAAGRIHTDFEKGFIMAEVMKYADFKEEGSEASVKAAGKYRQQGRNYVVEDGDIIFFKFNAGAGLKEGKKK